MLSRSALLLGLLLVACSGDSSDTGASASGTSAITSATASASASASATDATATSDASASASSSGTGDTSATSAASTTTAAASTTDASTTAVATTDPGTTTGEPSEHVMIHDPLIGGTLGSAVGGAFGDAGWTVTARTDRLYWSVPRLVEGSVEFTMTGVTLDLLPLNDHEVFAMYEGGYDISHPIPYGPDFRNNAFKSMIRIYGTAEVGREGQQKIMWGLCPVGAPGYHDGECPCANPVGFFEEPFGGDGTWDGSPQRLRVEWADGVTRYLRNDALVLTIDWSDAGIGFGPEDLYVSLGTPRAEAVDSAGMPIGAVFSDVKIEGWTGPAAASCL